MAREVLTKESLANAAKLIARRDTDFAGILKAYGPPPLWARPAGFLNLIKSILGAVSLASAASFQASEEKHDALSSCSHTPVR